MHGDHGSHRGYGDGGCGDGGSGDGGYSDGGYGDGGYGDRCLTVLLRSCCATYTLFLFTLALYRLKYLVSEDATLLARFSKIQFS